MRLAFVRTISEEKANCPSKIEDCSHETQELFASIRSFSKLHFSH